MPLYEYQCDACGHRFEQIQRFSDPLLTVCPKCDGTIRKLVSSPAIQFKGTGWYVTDYAKKGTDAEANKSSDVKDAKTAKSDAKSGYSTSSSDSSKTKSKSSTSSSSPTSTTGH